MGKVKVSKCGGGAYLCERGDGATGRSRPGTRTGLREGFYPGHLALLSTYLVQPARLFTCITLLTSLILTVRRVLFTNFRDGTCEAQRGNMTFQGHTDRAGMGRWASQKERLLSSESEMLGQALGARMVACAVSLWNERLLRMVGMVP